MKKPAHKAIKLYLAACSFAPCMVSLAGVCLLVDVDFAAVSGTTDGVQNQFHWTASEFEWVILNK